MQVDPKNRLVADALEADWNGKLRLLTEAQEQYQQQRQQDQMVLDERSRRQVLALAQDLPRLWRDPATSDQDRKRMVHPGAARSNTGVGIPGGRFARVAG